MYVGCSLGVKEEKACWALINDSGDGMGGGRGGTESSSVAAGCSLETTDISEVLLYIIEDEARSVGHLAETSRLLAGWYSGFKCALVALVLAWFLNCAHACTSKIFKVVSRNYI